MYANQKGEFTCRKQEWRHKKYKEMNWSFIIISLLRYSTNVTYLMSDLGVTGHDAPDMTPPITRHNAPYY